MDDSPKARYAASAPAEVRTVVTPPKRENRSHKRPPARAAADPYHRLSSQLTPTPSERFSLRPQRQRCISTGSAATTKIFYPELIPDAATTARDGQQRRVSASSLPTPEPSEGRVISEPNKSPSRPRVSTPSKSEPTLPSTPQSKGADEAGLCRPKRPHHAKSAPLPGPKVTPSEIDQRIVDQLKKPLTQKECTNQGFGNNYIFETIVASSPGKKVMKIGRTQGSEYVRLGTISRGCQHALIEKQDDPEHMPIRLHGRAEILMHKELEDFRYTFRCRCKKVNAHREYFNIDKDIALDVVQRWRRFCQQEPYGGDGILKPFWEQRLRDLGRFGKPEEELDHWSRGSRWDKFTSPSNLELVLFDISSTIEKIWRRRWETVAFAQSVIILFLSFPCVYTVVCCIAVCCGIMMELGNPGWPMLFRSIFTMMQSTSPKQATVKPRKDAVDKSMITTECRESTSPTEEPGEEFSCIETENSDPSEEDEDVDDDGLPAENEEEPDTTLLEDTASETSERADLVSEEPSR